MLKYIRPKGYHGYHVPGIFWTNNLISSREPSPPSPFLQRFTVTTFVTYGRHICIGTLPSSLSDDSSNHSADSTSLHSKWILRRIFRWGIVFHPFLLSQIPQRPAPEGIFFFQPNLFTQNFSDSNIPTSRTIYLQLMTYLLFFNDLPIFELMHFNQRILFTDQAKADLRLQMLIPRMQFISKIGRCDSFN